VVALQELKTPTVEFPSKALAEAGYDSLVVGQRTWNGVALFAPRARAAARGGLAAGRPEGQGDRVRWFERMRLRAAELWASGQSVVLMRGSVYIRLACAMYIGAKDVPAAGRRPDRGSGLHGLLANSDVTRLHRILSPHQTNGLLGGEVHALSRAVSEEDLAAAERLLKGIAEDPSATSHCPTGRSQFYPVLSGKRAARRSRF
jgi:hypothetical protein